MKFIFSLLFLFFAEILFPSLSLSQQFNFKNYSVEDGVAQSQVYSLIEDSRGYMWMGTRGGGITRFDGINFKTFSQKDGLSNNYIYCIYEDKEKNVWIGSKNGLTKYNGLKFENFYPENNLDPVEVRSIVQDDAGLFWLATNQGIYIFNGKKFFNFSVDHKVFKGSVNCIYIDKKGILWIGANDGVAKIIHYPKSRPEFDITLYTQKNGLENGNIQAICEDASGNIWAGSYGNGIFILEGEKFIRNKDLKILSLQIVQSIFRDSKNNMWVGTMNSGVFRWNDGDSSYINLSTYEGLSNNNVHVIMQDQWGSYWFGTSGGGICKYYGQSFTNFTMNSGLNGNFIYSVFCDSKKRIWVGNSDRGVCVYDNGHFIPYSAKEDFKNIKVKAIAEAPDSSIWLGADAHGVTKFDGKEFTVVKELKDKFVNDIQRDSSGDMWIATAGSGIYQCINDSASNYTWHNYSTDGISTLQNNDHGSRSHWEKWDEKNTIAEKRINCLHVDKWQRLWYGTESSGIGIIQNDTTPRGITEKDSLASNLVRCFAEDQFGYLWVGTMGNGISRLKIYDMENNAASLESRSFEIKNIYPSALTSGNIYLLTFDDEGNLFVGSESGIDKIILDKERNVVSVKHFGKAEGFTGIETCRSAVCTDRIGNIWFGTINGLTRYNPKTKIHNDKAPLISISQVSLFYEPLQKTIFAKAIGAWNNVTGELIFPHDQNHISFDLSAINLSSPENVKLSWMLEGFEKEWSPPSNHYSATYSNLPPGDYTFLAKAYNEDNVCNTEPLKLHFVILKPFWAEWWFILSVSGSSLLIIILIFRVRVSQIRKRGAEQRRRLQMEKSMIELEQKALRLQMNPHFIFNALNSIQSLISKHDEQTARFYLAKFSKLMRMILENSRSVSISLEDEIKTLENYLALEKFCSGDTFDYKIESNNIETAEISIPPMMIQPFAENAVIHGLKHLDKRGEIIISFSLKGNILECSISDNGIGRVKAAELNLAQQEQEHKSTALKVTQERLDMLDKEDHSSSLEIIDMKDENGNAKGTKVVIRVKI